MTESANTFQPLVTIVIPVYNGQEFLREAIDSALMQSYTNIEVIVVNDGSTDLTEVIAKSYKDKIRYFYKPNGGVASALNFAIQKAKGVYVSWLSCDDLYFPQKIEQQIKRLEYSKNRSAVVFSNYVKFSSPLNAFCVPYCDWLQYTEQQLLEKARMHEVNCYDMGCKENQKIDKSTIVSLLFRGYINGCSLLIPKEVFNKIGYFNEKLLTTQDYDMWFEFVKKNVDFVFSDNFVVKARQHAKQGTVSLASTCRKEERRLFKKAGITFFDLIVHMDDFTFQEVKKRLRHIQGKPLLFFILFFRYLVGIFGVLKK